jgi:exosome complex RNA-binding protein Rrp4
MITLAFFVSPFPFFLRLPAESLEDFFDIGDPVRAVVIKVDHEQQIVVTIFKNQIILSPR